MFKSRIAAPLAVLALTLSACSAGDSADGESPANGEPTSSETEGSEDEATDAESADEESAKGSDGTTDAPEGDVSTVTLVTHGSFNLPEETLAQFTEETGYTVEVVAPGDAGALVNQLILTKDSPLGDAVFGIDNTFASRAVDEGVLAAAEVEGVPEGFDTFDNHLVPIDQGVSA